jgi:hypothetical protein
VVLRRWAWGQNASNPLGITALNTLCFSAPYCTPALWAYIIAETTNSSSSSVEKWCQQTAFGISLRYIQTAGDVPQLAAVALLSLLLSHALVTVDDDELYSSSSSTSTSSSSSSSTSSSSVSAVLPLHELRRAVRSFKHLLYRGLFSDAPLPGRIQSSSSLQQQQEYESSANGSNSTRRTSFAKQDSYSSESDAPSASSVLTDFSGFLLGTLERVLSRLHSRAARRPFGALVVSAGSDNSSSSSSSRFADGSAVNSEDIGDALWLVPDAASKRVLGEVSHLQLLLLLLWLRSVKQVV